MGQRINIQYSVDVEELATEITRLLQGAYNQCASLEKLCDSGAPSLSYQTLEHIDKLRLELAAIDHRLNDTTNIITGYLNYRGVEGTKPSSDEPPETLEDRLTSFKKLMAVATNNDDVTD
jgi:hypothetical protein|tara:strand:- start:837 stop:1196 length:360 start_codon:yes stop_codon:yes gene_type:complete